MREKKEKWVEIEREGEGRRDVREEGDYTLVLAWVLRGRG